jgi:hypothetical protein
MAGDSTWYECTLTSNCHTNQWHTTDAVHTDNLTPILRLQAPNMRSFHALSSRTLVELHFLTLTQRFGAIDDCRPMRKHIFTAVVRRNKPKPLDLVELFGSSCGLIRFHFWIHTPVHHGSAIFTIYVESNLLNHFSAIKTEKSAYH